MTTFAVALAACWPSARRVVVETDGSGGDLAARFALRPSPGLVSLAAEARTTTSPDAGLVWRHAQPIEDGLLVVAAPPGAAEANAALQAMRPHAAAVWREAARDPETLVVLDAGRLDPAASAVPVDGVDVLLVLSGARADDLAHLPGRLKTLGRGCRQRRLLLVGDGYATAEVERELGVRISARIPHDPQAAASLRGLGAGRRHSKLGRAVRRCAQSLLTHTPTPAVPVSRASAIPAAAFTPDPRSWPAGAAASAAAGSNGDGTTQEGASQT